jgi:hypothetical protein
MDDKLEENHKGVQCSSKTEETQYSASVGQKASRWNTTADYQVQKKAGADRNRRGCFEDCAEALRSFAAGACVGCTCFVTPALLATVLERAKPLSEAEDFTRAMMAHYRHRLER